MSLASTADDSNHSIGVRLCPRFGLSGKSMPDVNTDYTTAHCHRLIQPTLTQVRIQIRSPHRLHEEKAAADSP